MLIKLWFTFIFDGTFTVYRDIFEYQGTCCTLGSMSSVSNLQDQRPPVGLLSVMGMAVQ